MANTLELKVTKIIDIDEMAGVLEDWFDDYFTDFADFTDEEVRSIDRETVKKALAKIWLGE